MKMHLIILMALLLFNALAYAQGASECRQRILLLPQTHASVLGGRLQVTPENFDGTARSQFSIAKYLEKNRDIPVFSEQVSSNQSVQTVSVEFRRTAAQIKTMFPNGLPPRFEHLTAQQKDVLAQAGGDAVSFILRNTEMLHRTVENDKIQDELISKVSRWVQMNPLAMTYSREIENTIFSVRERLALDQINNYFKANPSRRDAILIYGSDHYQSFLTHSDKFPRQCILVPYEFQSAVTSPYSPYGAGSHSGSTSRAW